MPGKSRRIREDLKTTISTTTDIYDRNGQWLPPGNYYFTITSIGNKYAKGILTNKDFKSEYSFKMKDVIRMMAIAQARLARRASIDETMMPKYKSPNSSIETEYPKELAKVKKSKEIKKIANKTSSICTICLEPLGDNPKKLSCNHRFHLQCISQWYHTKKNCPVCRKTITSLDERVKPTRGSLYRYYPEYDVRQNPINRRRRRHRRSEGKYLPTLHQ